MPKLLLALFVLAVIGLAALSPFAAKAACRAVSGIPCLSVREVKVFGLKHVRASDFINYMGDPRGTGILAFDKEAALRKVAAHPWIKASVIRRELPGTVRVEVIEREPAAIADAGPARFVIDNNGVALAGISGGQWNFLPVIQYPSAGGDISGGKAANGLKKAIELMDIVRKEPTERLAGAEMLVDEDGSPCMRILGAVVKVGQDGYEEKVRRLSEVALDIQKRGASPALIDLRFPGKVVVKEGRTERAGQERHPT